MMSKGAAPHILQCRVNDVPIAEPLIQAFKVLDVSSKMVQEHHIEENSHDLRERRISLISGLSVMFEVFAADTDRENFLRPHADDRAERLLKAHAAITEESRLPLDF